MKKKIIYSSALAALFSASIALAGGEEIIPVEDYFSGFYVGGFGGVHHTDFNGNSQIDLTENIPNGEHFPNHPHDFDPIFVPGNVISNTANGESVDGYGGVDGGLNWTFQHRWVLGVFGWGAFGNQNSTDSYTATPVSFHDRRVSDNFRANNTITQSISNDYGVGGKGGFNPYPTLLLYGTVAASWAKITVNNSVTAQNDFERESRRGHREFSAVTDIDGGSSSSQTKTGVRFGLGAEQFVYKDVASFFLEWNYVNYGTVSTGPAPLEANTVTHRGHDLSGDPHNFDFPFTTSASTKAKVDTFMAGFNFYFLRHLAIF
jgi:Outer membrane protein beta-barrel domain